MHGQVLCRGLFLRFSAIPPLCFDHADHCLPTRVDVHMLDRHLLLPLAAMLVEGPLNLDSTLGGLSTVTENVNVATFDSDSPTSGIQEAIDALGDGGGCVRIPAGEWRLRGSVVLPSRVCLFGDGPATELTASRPEVVRLTRDARKGSRSVCVRGRVPFLPGDSVGLVDNAHQWWDGTHACVASVEGGIVRLTEPIRLGLKVALEARICSLFPGVTTEGTGPPGDTGTRKGTQDSELRDLTLLGTVDQKEPAWDFTYSAVHLVACESIRVLNLTVRDWPSDAIGVQGGWDVHVHNCRSRFCRGNGFHPGTHLGRTVWSNNIAIGNGMDGLFICSLVHDSVFTSNVFTGNSQNGIGGVGHHDDHHNVISNNVCSENGRSGINAHDGSEHTITGNILRSNSWDSPGTYPAIRLHSATRFLVQGNRCADDQQKPTQKRGIVETGDSDWNLVTGNVCVGMPQPVSLVGSNSLAEGNLV